MQKARTIEDHRTRYPRQADNAQAGPQTGAGPSHIGNPPNPADPHVSPTSSPNHTMMGDDFEPESPVVSRIEDNDRMDIDPPRPQSLFAPGDNLPQVPGENILQPDSPIAPDVGPELLDVAEELAREYRFDRLVDEEDDRRRHELGDHAGDDHGEFGFGLENGIDDVDFGLPNGEDRDVGLAGAALPRFQLPEDIEPDDPEDQPEGDDGGEGPDALFQKTLYGATHRALKHQLKTARRTISAHPDIVVEDITKMAQTIGTVERRLGVNTDDMITTFTLCPICKRRYSPEYIRETNNEHCLNNGCEGTLFTIRPLASGRSH
ncbi:hypothetical protein FRC07_006509 [Ceratobasidium sp. 392]|nr:hypothetical protein FRC07_006509 [Ceratobasidium sp. 392]